MAPDPAWGRRCGRLGLELERGGVVAYRHKKWLGFNAGYKALGVDYKTGSASGPDRFSYDVIYHGPIAGLELHW